MNITDPIEIAKRVRAFEARTYMFSDSTGLMCRIRKDGTYQVINGNWVGVRNGDSFLIVATGKKLSITDWREIKLGDLSEVERSAWFLPVLPDLFDYSIFDDDIPF